MRQRRRNSTHHLPPLKVRGGAYIKFYTESRTGIRPCRTKELDRQFFYQRVAFGGIKGGQDQRTARYLGKGEQGSSIHAANVIFVSLEWCHELDRSRHQLEDLEPHALHEG